ncbi:MAG: tetratricopeptide repeat protein [Betaproteobacteria bacterium]|nr:tetratricopeptide repeat protein [Betaproteobacteria bacterium]MDH3437908.1 tetratricopeptide repeat protein [Betaproteobacteria bacterium]
MSLINQVLVDLELRRASGPERQALPNHVRALPAQRRGGTWRGLVIVGLVAAVGLTGAWALIPVWDTGRKEQPPSVITPPAVAFADGPTAAGSAAAATGAREGERAERVALGPVASRLTLELSSVPPAVPAVAEARERAASIESARILPRAEPPEHQGQAATAAVPAMQPRPEAVRKPAKRAKAPPAAVKAPAVGHESEVQKEKQVRPTPSAQTARNEQPKERVATIKPSPDAGAPQVEIEKQVRQPTAAGRAQNEYRKATIALRQGRADEAQDRLQAALKIYPGHRNARQALVGLLLDSKQYEDAGHLLQEGLALDPDQTGFAMALARIQLEGGDIAQATRTLRGSLEHARSSPDYLAFLAALLQRQTWHNEAIEQFRAALRMRPRNGVWWLGLGVSFQAISSNVEAQDAYLRAKASNNLNPELMAFADQRLRQLR